MSLSKIDRTVAALAIVFTALGGLVGTLVTVGVSKSRLSNVENELSKREQVVITQDKQGRTLAVLENKYSVAHRTNLIQDAKIESMDKRLYILEGNTKVTNSVLENLAVAVKEFSETTKTLTDVLIRVKVIEQTTGLNNEN